MNFNNDPNIFMFHSNSMDDTLYNIGDYNPKRKKQF